MAKNSIILKIFGFLWLFIKTLFMMTLRLALFCAMFGLILFSAAWLFFLYAFNAQNMSEVIVSQLQEHLDRPVKIASMDLRFVNTIELKGFSVTDTKGDVGNTLISADSVLIIFEFLPLFERQLIIDRVILNSPHVNIVRLADGTTNIPVIKRTQGNASVYLGDSEKPFSISAGKWIMYKGVFNYNDLKKNVSHSLYNVNLSLEQLKFNEPCPFETSMVVRNQWDKNISDIEIRATGSVNLADFDKTKFALRSVNAQVQALQKPINMVFDFDNLVTPFFKAKLEVPAFSGKDLDIFGYKGADFPVPNTEINVQGAVSQNYQYVKLSQFSVSGDNVKISGNLTADLTKKQPAYDITAATSLFDLPKLFPYFTLLKKYDLKGKGSFNAHITGAGNKWKVPSLSAKLQGASGDLYGFKTSDVTGEFEAKNDFSDLYAHATNGRVGIARTTFDKLDISASWRKGNLYANIHSGEVNGVGLKMNLDIQKLTDPQRLISTNMYWKKFDPMAFIETVRDFVTVITPLTRAGGEETPEATGELAWLRNFRDRLPNFMPNFTGTLTADEFSSGVLTGNRFDAQFDLSGLFEGGKSLSGIIQARLAGGVIHQMEKWADEQEALNVTFQPFIIMHRMERAGSFKMGRVLKDVEFTDMAAGVTFNNGQMTIQNAYNVGPTLSASVDGSIDWINEKFDMMIGTMFTNTSKSGALAENLTDESGNPALKFRVSGSMLKPKVEMKRAKKTGEGIRAAQAKGLTTDFNTAQYFREGEFHAKK